MHVCTHLKVTCLFIALCAVANGDGDGLSKTREKRALPVLRGVSSSLVQKLVTKMGRTFVSELSAKSYVVTQPHEGAVWISLTTGTWGSWNGEVISCYYHPTRKHTATTVGKLGTQKSEAAGGQWACSQQTRGRYGNKTYYNTL